MPEKKSQKTGQPTSITEQQVIEPARIESVQAQVDASNPQQAIFRIQGLLHDGSTRIQSLEQSRSSDGAIHITVTATRLRGGSGSVSLIPFERVFTLSILGLASGPHVVTANDASTTLYVP